jgi:hypothetical protein
MPRILNLKRLIAIVAVAAASTSCGSVVRSGSSPMFLVINSLGGAPGGPPVGQLSGTLLSDVISSATPPTILPDTGQVVLSASLKDIGSGTTPVTPTTNNQITITRYHVAYVRSDGRNTEGVDVPYAFDGAVTGTITTQNNTLQMTFELVQTIAKQQSPLVQLETSSAIITTIANVTFYGTDQVGNSINVTGSMTIEFGNFPG